MNYYVYILASNKNGTLYVGFTVNIQKRINEHKNNKYDGFTKKYDVKRLVYFEDHIDKEVALNREKQLKKWNRNWKIELIEKNNPEWKDLSLEFKDKLGHEEILRIFFNKSCNND